MNEAQIDRLLDELVETRKSFDAAVNIVKWNRRNTVIQYCLIFLVIFGLVFGRAMYLEDRRNRCESGNLLRAGVVQAFDEQAASIGLALAAVTGATPDQYGQYLAEYRSQPKPDALSPVDCS